MIGQTLSHFKITAKLGEGGMGEVYRAEDTKLGRDVAIKVLPEAFSADPERLARFEREAQVLASLNHPNIAGIHEFREVEIDGENLHFLVMELAAGQDLAERLRQGALPIGDALPIALQMAEGLEAAHEKGIIHRDLKPANVMISPDGQVKILDFGLAKALEAPGGGAEAGGLSISPTLTAQMTQAGVLLGTAAYMSPEQARGEEADNRADIWAFGVVLYEILTGARPLEGASLTDLLAEIVKGEPDWTALPRDVPPAVTRLLRRCLAKDRRQRLQAIGDARIEIEELMSSATTEELTTNDPATKGPSRRALLGIVALTAVVAAFSTWRIGSDARSPGPTFATRTLVATPELARLTQPAIAPDGRSIAFVGDGRLWVHNLEDASSNEIAGTAGATNPFWSPDGRWIGFFDRLRLLKVSASGGEVVPLATLQEEMIPQVGSGSWTDDGRILASGGVGGIISVPEGGGAPTPYLEPSEAEHFHEVRALPSNRGAVFFVDPDGDQGRIDLLIDGQRIRGPAASGSPAYSAAGYLLFQRSSGVWAVSLDLDSPNSSPAEPFLLVPGASNPSLGGNDALLIQRPAQKHRQLALVDSTGVVRQALDEPRLFAMSPSLSPDGSRVAMLSENAGRASVLVLEPGRGTRQWLTRMQSSSLALEFVASPVWSADGASLFHVGPGPRGSDAEEAVIRRQRLGESEFEVLVEGYDPKPTPDGKYLVFASGDFAQRDIRYLDLGEPSLEPMTYLAEAGFQGQHQLSPDGRHIAYLHSDTGMTGLEVYVSRFPRPDYRIQVSNGGCAFSTTIRWSADGRHIYYVRASDGVLVDVEVDLEDEPELSPPRELFSESSAGLDLSAGFDLAPEPDRFLVIRTLAVPGGDRGGMLLIQNWTSLLRSAGLIQD